MHILLIVAFGILGAILASFAGVVSERLSTGESWAASRSKCNSCGRALSGPDLIPIVSWVLSFGRCRTCRASVPYRYALSELALALLFVVSYEFIGLAPALPFLLASWFLLAIIVLYDFAHTIVPLTVAVLFIASAIGYALLAYEGRELGLAFLTAGSIGFGFLLLHLASRGRWMGLGDAPIALGLSLLTGSNALSGLIFSFWIGAVIGIVILVMRPKGHRMGIEVPFVPFLAAGYLLAFFTQWNLFLL